MFARIEKSDLTRLEDLFCVPPWGEKEAISIQKYFKKLWSIQAFTSFFLDLQLEEEKKLRDLQISLGASPSAHEGASAVLGCCCFPSKSLCSASSPIFRLGTNGAVTPVTGDPVGSYRNLARQDCKNRARRVPDLARTSLFQHWRLRGGALICCRVVFAHKRPKIFDRIL